jgi:hypothetical protein
MNMALVQFAIFTAGSLRLLPLDKGEMARESVHVPKKYFGEPRIVAEIAADVLL